MLGFVFVHCSKSGKVRLFLFWEQMVLRLLYRSVHK